MRSVTKDEFVIKKFGFFKAISDGAVFIHPTDTIYGLGCDATNDAAVKKLRELKEQNKRPLSVIVPDLDWVKENCVVDKSCKEWLKKLPGPYTLIFKLKNPKCVADSVKLGHDTLGIRMIDHWFQEYVQEFGRPVITTSANKIGKIFMTSADDLDSEIKIGVDFMIYEGEKQGSASNIVNLTTECPEVRER